ncbi:SusD/RagB family nutrient-binding outer membrane lipoprotein [Chitinophaga sancti]|uniref:SusD/RagB family nutrient-binding outer membrane lipoprotein n=1 Tax=Chitinophaga sancti TaxID=1004 RepID=UPI002A759745|nr:SusD/RagB family nutrient-binding outer membrane lipoprotein [Chitinophaga sancti]WPQ65336.1 SusD/RagB family nutrient-binding outer membrane lipoprotein [Chitinophaga sancti]
MRRYQHILIIALSCLIMTACNKKIEELQANPNEPGSVTAELLLGAVLTDMSGTQDDGSLEGYGSWGAVHRWNQYFCRNYEYYGDNQYGWSSGSFDSYIVLKNVVQMEKEAATRGADSINPYESIGKFVRAYYYYNMTSMMGDIPLDGAVQGTANLTPAYASQKDVFTFVLNTLDTVNNHLTTLINAGDNTINGSTQDIYYAGDLTKWRKLVNSFKLRVLISLSNKTSDNELNVVSQFATIINNPSTYPIFTSVDDDFKFTYVETYNVYPQSPNNFGSDAQRYNMANTYVHNLTDLNDARVFITCEPAWNIIATKGYSAVDYRSFVGASTGESIANMYSDAIAGNLSLINRKHYYETYTGEPDVLVGYKEMCFNIAEAINRGWISGDAETWYNTGITESMKFYGITASQTSYTAYFLKFGSSLGDYTSYAFTFDLSTYLAQSSVKYAGADEGLKQILTQKYIAMFQNSGWEAYFNYRRTGVPVFDEGTGIGNNGVIPKRWGYPSSEQNLNAANWKAALSNQGLSSDDINGSMWLLK